MARHLYIEGLGVILKWILGDFPHKSRLGSEKYLFEITLNFLYHRHDFNQRMKPLEKLKNSILLIRIS